MYGGQAYIPSDALSYSNVSKRRLYVRFLLKKGVAGHRLVDTRQYFVSLEEKMVLALTLFIIIVKELELDEFQIVVVQVFLHYSFMIYDEVTS